jgi:hypothetical protein
LLQNVVASDNKPSLESPHTAGTSATQTTSLRTAAIKAASYIKGITARAARLTEQFYELASVSIRFIG